MKMKEDYLKLYHSDGDLVAYACKHCGAYAFDKNQMNHFPMCTLRKDATYQYKCDGCGWVMKSKEMLKITCDRCDMVMLEVKDADKG